MAAGTITEVVHKQEIIRAFRIRTVTTATGRDKLDTPQKRYVVLKTVMKRDDSQVYLELYASRTTFQKRSPLESILVSEDTCCTLFLYTKGVQQSNFLGKQTTILVDRLVVVFLDRTVFLEDHGDKADSVIKAWRDGLLDVLHWPDANNARHVALKKVSGVPEPALAAARRCWLCWSGKMIAFCGGNTCAPTTCMRTYPPSQWGFVKPGNGKITFTFDVQGALQIVTVIVQDPGAICREIHRCRAPQSRSQSSLRAPTSAPREDTRVPPPGGAEKRDGMVYSTSWPGLEPSTRRWPSRSKSVDPSSSIDNASSDTLQRGERRAPPSRSPQPRCTDLPLGAPLSPLAQSGSGTDLRHGAPLWPLPQSGSGTDLPHGAPLWPLPQSGSGTHLPHGTPPSPLPQSGSGADLLHGAPLSQSGSGTHLPHGAPPSPLPQSGRGTDLLHGAPSSPLAQSGSGTDLRHGAPLWPLPQSDRGADLPHGAPPSPLPQSGRGADLPHGAPPSPLPQSGSGTDLPHGAPPSPLPQPDRAGNIPTYKDCQGLYINLEHLEVTIPESPHIERHEEYMFDLNEVSKHADVVSLFRRLDSAKCAAKMASTGAAWDAAGPAGWVTAVSSQDGDGGRTMSCGAVSQAGPPLAQPYCAHGMGHNVESQTTGGHGQWQQDHHHRDNDQVDIYDTLTRTLWNHPPTPDTLGLSPKEREKVCLKLYDLPSATGYTGTWEMLAEAIGLDMGAVVMIKAIIQHHSLPHTAAEIVLRHWQFVHNAYGDRQPSRCPRPCTRQTLIDILEKELKRIDLVDFLRSAS